MDFSQALALCSPSHGVPVRFCARSHHRIPIFHGTEESEEKTCGWNMLKPWFLMVKRQFSCRSIFEQNYIIYWQTAYSHCWCCCWLNHAKPPMAFLPIGIHWVKSPFLGVLHPPKIKRQEARAQDDGHRRGGVQNEERCCRTKGRRDVRYVLLKTYETYLSAHDSYIPTYWFMMIYVYVHV